MAAIVLTDNEFFTGLTNLALFMRLYATNTSDAPETFVDSFMTETLGSGNTKIFPWSDLPAVGDYSGTSTLLTVKKVATLIDICQWNNTISKLQFDRIYLKQ